MPRHVGVIRLVGRRQGRLRQLYRETIGDGLPGDQADRLAHRFAHVPVKGLRALARRYGVEAATTFLAETDPR